MTDKNEVENEDKQVIGDEEREQMLNKENAIREDVKTKIEEIDKIDKEKEMENEKEKNGDEEKEVGVVKTGEVEKRKKQLEESQKESRLSAIRVPIGGIKIPGFLRSRSRDKNKEGDGTTEEGLDLLEAGGQKTEKADKTEKSEGGIRATLARRLDTLAARSPFAKKERQEPADGAANDQPRTRLLDRFNLPAVSVLPKKFTRGNKKEGAEVPSDETLQGEKPSSPDDGMESVKLDADGEGEKDPEKAGLNGDTPKRPIHLIWLERLRNLSRHEKFIGAALVLLLVILIIILVATTGGPIPTAPPVVNGKVITTTQCGPVEGSLDKEIFTFLGIPYAAPPVGRRRWKPAQPLTSLNLCWNDTLYRANSSSSARQCWQHVSPDRIDGYEDCLYLDIWTPEVRYTNPLPVVVLIDAATLLGGPQGVLIPSPKIVQDREVVFVRPNFRLGVLGFLAASPLSMSVHPPTSGNYGLSDIIVALKWVQTNIAHFGGDPAQVTLVGHRAGATLVTALSVSPAAKGLFQRAWASSGSAWFPGEAQQGETAQAAGQRYVDGVCPADEGDQLECLMTKNAETLLEAVDDNWKPPVRTLPDSNEDSEEKHDWITLDGRILQTHVWSGLENRHATLIVGTAAQSESSQTLWEQVAEASGTRQEAIVGLVRNSVVGKLGLADEAINRYNETWEGLVSMVTDIRTVCPLLAMTRTQPNITFYVASQPRNYSEGSIADVSLDMSTVLGGYTPDAAPQRSFVKAMQALFYNFVSQGTLPPMPTPAPSQPVLTVANVTEWRSDYPNCGFWVSKEIVPKYARRD